MMLSLLMLTALTCNALAEDQWTAADLSLASEDMPLSEDITQLCLINGKSNASHLNKMRDGNYRSIWESRPQSGLHELFLTIPEDKLAGGLMIKWRSFPMRTRIQQRDADGVWQTVATGGDEFQAQYIPLPNITGEIRIVGGDNDHEPLKICEIIVMTPGRLPEWFQLWQQPPEKVDMMQLAGHPDDELLWFGGMLPTYAGQQKKNVLVVCAAFRNYHRRLEMLDGLWTCGVKIHPIFIGFVDEITSDMNKIYQIWGRQKSWDAVAALYRRYKPDVVVLQDIKGEYGHGVHKAFTDVGMKAVPLAADEAHDPDSLALYGAWNVPKVYIHLYPENQIQMDWHVPLSAFGGKTSQDVTREAFLCHVTQQGSWKVWDGGQWDNSLFGLWHSTVGEDVLKNDMFENIE